MYGRLWLLGSPRAKRDGRCCRLPTAVRSLGGSWQRSWFRKLGFAFLFCFALLLWLIIFMTTGAKGSMFKWNLAVVKILKRLIMIFLKNNHTMSQNLKESASDELQRLALTKSGMMLS